MAAALGGGGGGGGGIFPIAHHCIRIFLNVDNPRHGCQVCRSAIDPDVDLWIESARSFLHRGCLPEFLATPDGRRMLEDGESVVVPAVGGRH